MARYKLTHACGHEVTHQIVGRHRERSAAIAREEHRDCRSCYVAARDAARAAAHEAAAKVNAEQGLPDLIGSPKQIAWAEGIRWEAMKHLQVVAGWTSLAERTQG
jgi:hypothetical protein